MPLLPLSVCVLWKSESNPRKDLSGRRRGLSAVIGARVRFMVVIGTKFCFRMVISARSGSVKPDFAFVESCMHTVCVCVCAQMKSKIYVWRCAVCSGLK